MRMSALPPPDTDSPWFDQLRRLFETEIPFNRLLGLRLDIRARGDIRLTMPFQPALIGDPVRPALHGGTLSTLIDTAGGAATYTAVDPRDRVSTLDMRVDYLQPGAPADTWAIARLVRMGGRVAVVRVQVFQAEGRADRPAAEDRLIAEGTAVYAVRRGR